MMRRSVCEGGWTARSIPVAIAAAVVAALVLAFVVKSSLAQRSTGAPRATFAVKRGPLAITITETGELAAADSIRISPATKGTAVIIELVDEGARVGKGDVLVRFDSTDLEQREATQAIELENALANLVRAQEERRIQELTNETNIARARLSVINARMELEKYGIVALAAEGVLDRTLYTFEEEAIEQEGAAPAAPVIVERSATGASDGVDVAAMTIHFGSVATEDDVPVGVTELMSSLADSLRQLSLESTDALSAMPSLLLPDGRPRKGEAYQSFRDAELAIDKARTDLETAEDDFQGMDRLLERDFITRNDYILSKLKRDEAINRLESTMLAHDILRIYTYPKNIVQRRSDLKKALDELKQAELSASAQMAQRVAAIAQSEAVYNNRKRTLDDTSDQLSKMVIHAPQDGLVLYGDERRPMEREEVKVGGRAFEGRTILTLPSITNMIAASKVQEKDIYKVRSGHRARVTLPALPGVTLTGRVSRISNVASTAQRWMAASESKTFDVEITLDQSDERMKPGMSCEVAILIETIEDCLYVPVNAVFRQDGKDFCNVVRAGKVMATPVTLGPGNEIYVSIREGLAEGTEVLLYNIASGDGTMAQSPVQREDFGVSEAAPAGDEPSGGQPAIDSTAFSAERAARMREMRGTGARPEGFVPGEGMPAPPEGFQRGGGGRMGGGRTPGGDGAAGDDGAAAVEAAPERDPAAGYGADRQEGGGEQGAPRDVRGGTGGTGGGRGR